MRAATQLQYCQPEALRVEQVEVPSPGPGEVLVRVRASSINPLDWHSIIGRPMIMRMQSGLRRPKQQIAGTDLSGVVEALGPAAEADATAGADTPLQVGDEVFGYCSGAFAEFVAVKRSALARKPANASFVEAAAVPVAAASALQAGRVKAGLQAGQRVAIIGAGGGVGLFAVQIAAALGASVTGVCSAAKVEAVRAAGAHHVVDYTAHDALDLSTGTDPYDAIIDMVGDRRLGDLRRALRPTGALVIVGGPDGGPLLGPLLRMISAKLAFAFSKRRAVPFMARLDTSTVNELASLLSDGTLRPVIEQTYDLDHVGAAVRHVMNGHTLGKVVVSLDTP